MFVCLITLDLEGCRAMVDNLLNMGKVFPNTTRPFPDDFSKYFASLYLNYAECFEGNWEKAMKMCKVQYGTSSRGINGTLLPVNPHLECSQAFLILPTLMIFERIKGEPDADPIFGKALFAFRQQIEMFARVNPGTFRCGLQVYAAQITLALKDRPFEKTFTKLISTLEYAIEIDCLPLDVLLLKAEVARWKGDVANLSNVVTELETIGYNYQFEIQKLFLTKLKSGKLKAVDLSFVPEKPKEEELSDQEKLLELEEAIKNAKIAMNDAYAADDEEAANMARTTAKELKKEMKALKKKMESEAEAQVDQAKIDELKFKIAEARKRVNQAFDDDDDEAEEAAAAEVRALGKELAALTGGASIPRKKLQDAKKNDAFHQFVERAKKNLQGEDVGFKNSVKWNFEGAGIVVFDGSGGTIDVISEDRDADATLSMTMDTFSKLATKELDFMAAMGQQLIKVDGNMAVLMGLKPLMVKLSGKKEE